MASNQRMRLFVGVPVAVEVADALSAAADKLPNGYLRTAPENMHITLSFLGETPEQQIPSLITELDGVRHPHFTIKVAGIGTFPGVVFAKVESSPALEKLAADARDRMARCGFPPERRPYRPHITLARARVRALRTPELPLVPLQFEAGQFVLYRSLLGSPGAHYQQMRVFALSG